MNMVELKEFLFWSMVINFGVLTWWLFFILTARRWVYRLHTRFFQISEHRFDSMHYAGMMAYKLAILLFNVAPWLALHIMSS